MNKLEDTFNVAQDSTESIFGAINAFKRDHTLPTEVVNHVTGEVVALHPDSSDVEQEHAERVEDIQLQGQYEAIYKSAVGAFEAQLELSQDVEPRFSARNAEVAAQYLNIALNSTKDRTEAKFKREKTKLAKKMASGDAAGAPKNTINIFGDRNEILKMLRDAASKDITNEA